MTYSDRRRQRMAHRRELSEKDRIIEHLEAVIFTLIADKHRLTKDYDSLLRDYSCMYNKYLTLSGRTDGSVTDSLLDNVGLLENNDL